MRKLLRKAIENITPLARRLLREQVIPLVIEIMIPLLRTTLKHLEGVRA